MKDSARESQPKSATEFFPPGIPNLGNTCYLSCIMQVMINCPPIAKAIQRTPASDFNSNFRRAFKKLYDAINSGDIDLEERKLKKFVSVASDELQVNLLVQQDFFEISSKITKMLPERIQSSCRSIIIENSVVRDKLTKTSSYETDRYDVFELVLEQEAGRVKMVSMLDRYFDSEDDNYDKTVFSNKKLAYPPDLLFLSVPRVDENHNFYEVLIKIDTRIDITRYNELFQSSNYYDLFGALYHSKDLEQGHYVIWLKSGYRYFIFDDSRVRISNLSHPPNIENMSIVGLIYIDSHEEVPLFKKLHPEPLTRNLIEEDEDSFRHGSFHILNANRSECVQRYIEEAPPLSP